MKSKILVFVFIVSFSICLYGQSSSSQRIENYLVIDKTNVIQIDSLHFINPKWIKKITLIKDEKYKDIYGNTGGRLFIYPKKRFKNTLENEYRKIVLIDSLKQEIFRDTIKFEEKDLVFTMVGRKNMCSYSMLYVVNWTYFYKLDIISSDLVVEFVNEFLDTEKVKDISLWSKKMSSAIFGTNAPNGAVLITLKKNAKFNPLVAGFNFTGNRCGDNFSKRNNNELMIRE